MELEKIQIGQREPLPVGAEKINRAIDASGKAEGDAASALARSLSAEQISLLSQAMSQQTQKQLDNIIIESGTSDAEVVQARDIFPVLNDRLNYNETQIEEKADIGIVKDFRDGYYAGPVVAFVFDDGRKEMWDLFKDLFVSEGVPCNIPVVTGYIDTHSLYMTTPQLRELQDVHGWGIYSHMELHGNALELTPEEVDAEYRNAHKWLKDKGFGSDIIVYPYGATDPMTRKIARKYYKMGVNIVRNGLSNDIPEIENLNLNRLAGLSQPQGAEPSYNEVKQRFDLGNVRNELMIYEDHAQYAIWTPEKIEELRTLIRYMKSQGVPIVTLEEAYRMKCNIIDVGEKGEESYYKLHRNGKESGGARVFNFATSDAYSAATPATEFPAGEITKFRINNDLTGLPLQTSGEISMDKTSIYSGNWKMEYYTEGLIFYRMWRNNAWTRWFSYGEVIGNSHTTQLPVAGPGNWRRMLLVRGHNVHEDKLIICTRNADSNYTWKEIQFTEYTV